jgi:hypothetical protein
MPEQELQHRLQQPTHEPAIQAESEEPEEELQMRFSADGALPPVAQDVGTAQKSASDRAYGEERQAHDVAAKGVSDGGQAMPFADQIQASFGAHGGAIASAKAHVGGDAKSANDSLGAQAYAYGNHVAFGQSPDLHTAAHEAAHVVQQNSGVQLKGGIGQANDQYEQNADAVADRVVQGKSAEDLLAPFAGGQGEGKAVQSKAVQFLGHELGKPLPEGAVTPVYGEDRDQRRYSREQYEGLWEEEQGRKLKPHEQATIERGCIGITAVNLTGGGNPLDYSEGNFATFEGAHKFMEGRNKELKEMRANPATAHLAPPEGEYVMFAKLFWSNQAYGDNSKPDEDAFKPDENGRIDMSGYRYAGQPKYVNFDYGFWDESTQSFWHANHMEYKDPEKRKTNPMKVYQSTKERFSRGYIDFDRILFGVALAKNYDPGKAAMDTAARGG